MRAALTDAERDASRWLVRLESPDVSLDDHRRFREWLAASDENRAAYGAMSGTWDKLDALAGVERPARASVNRRRAVLWGAGAAVAAGAALFFIAFQPQSSAAYETGFGEQRTIALADGSTVQLNADSRIRVRYSDNAREIQLDRGEALFDVHADADRPFLVETTLGAVRVRGTAFLVRISRDEMRTTVLRGAVEGRASPTAPPVMARPNDELRISTSGVQKEALTEQAAERRLAWRDGMLAFDGETLAEAAADVERQTGVRFVFADPTLGALRVGGYIRADDIDAFTALLQQNVGVRAQRRSEAEIVLTR